MSEQSHARDSDPYPSPWDAKRANLETELGHYKSDYQDMKAEIERLTLLVRQAYAEHSISENYVNLTMTVEQYTSIVGLKEMKAPWQKNEPESEAEDE